MVAAAPESPGIPDGEEPTSEAEVVEFGTEEDSPCAPGIPDGLDVTSEAGIPETLAMGFET